MGGAELAPLVDLTAPLVGPALADPGASLDAEGGRASPRPDEVGAEAVDLMLPRRLRRWPLPGGLDRAARHPAVGKAGGAPQRRLRFAADPHRDRLLHRQRVDAGVCDAVPA